MMGCSEQGTVTCWSVMGCCEQQIAAVLLTRHEICDRKFMIDTNRTVGYKEPLDSTGLLLHFYIKSGKHQCALHLGNSTANQFFILRQTLVKCREMNVVKRYLNLRTIAFVDF